MEHRVQDVVVSWANVLWQTFLGLHLALAQILPIGCEKRHGWICKTTPHWKKWVEICITNLTKELSFRWRKQNEIQYLPNSPPCPWSTPCPWPGNAYGGGCLGHSAPTSSITCWLRAKPVVIIHKYTDAISTLYMNKMIMVKYRKK